MTRPDVMVRIVVPHTDDGGYHRWVTLGERMRVNRLCVSNPRMYFAEATKWVCNGDCPGWAIVRDAAVENLLRHAGPRGCLPAGPRLL